MTIRFGLIGCGRIAERHVQTIARLTEAQLVAVSDILDERMNWMEETYSADQPAHQPIRKYSDYRQLLNDQEVDVVCITTVSGLHATIAKEALLARKHVVLEKPLALSINDAQDLIYLSESRKLCLLVCHQLRYRPIMQKVKECIEQNGLGPLFLGVVTLRVQRSLQYYESASWRGKWEMDGGMLINQGIHLIDLLQWFFGDVQQVFGSLYKSDLPKETEDLALGLLTFSNGARGIIETNTLTYPSNMEYSISLFGERGTISIGGLFLDQLIRWEVADYPIQQAEALELMDDKEDQLHMYQELIDCLNHRKSDLLMNGREGKRALETIFGLYKSAVMNRPVVLPIQSFSTANMKGRMR